MARKFKILLVDDSAVNLAAVEQKLKDLYDVVTINSGERALRYLKNEKCDLILLDIKMRGKDGIETLKELRAMENGADVPVIMLTSKNDKESVIVTAKYGICDYILKPFSTKDLERIERALDKAKRF